MKPVCDKCKKEFEIKAQTEKVKGDIRRVYFICPHCGKKYISYYLNSKIEQKQEKINKLYKKMNRFSLNEEKCDKYLLEIQNLKKEIKSDMQELKKRFEV